MIIIFSFKTNKSAYCLKINRKTKGVARKRADYTNGVGGRIVISFGVIVIFFIDRINKIYMNS